MPPAAPMLELVNKTPFAAALVPGLDKEGADYLSVVVKATFAIVPGAGVHVADEQLPVAYTDTHHGDPASSSVRFEADTALRKPAVDVLLVGTAYARSATDAVDVELRVDRL